MKMQTRQHFHAKAFAFHSSHSQQNLPLSVLRKQTTSTALQLPSAISLPSVCLHPWVFHTLPPSLGRINSPGSLIPSPYLFCTCSLWTVLYLKNRKVKQNKNIQLSSLFTLRMVPSRSWIVGAKHPPCQSKSLEQLPDFSKHV